MTLIDVLTERRLLAALIAEPLVLDAARDLETRDFTDYRHWVVFGAVRQLQHEGADIDVNQIDALLRQRDEMRDGFVSEMAGIWFLVDLLLETTPYCRAELWEHDLLWLRSLSDLRARLEAAA